MPEQALEEVHQLQERGYATVKGIYPTKANVSHSLIQWEKFFDLRRGTLSHADSIMQPAPWPPIHLLPT